MTTGEKWRVINGGLYSISTFGRIRREMPGCGATVGRILNYSPRKAGGYIVVALREFPDGPIKQFYLHVLVMETFRGLPPEGKQVNHRDGIKKNCRLTNLEYKTPKQNTHHAIRMGLVKRNGQDNPSAKLTNLQVDRIREMAGDFTRTAIARKFGVSIGTISHILTGRNWR